MSGSSGPPHDGIPRLFDSGEIETLRRARAKEEDGATRPVRHPWPVVAEHYPRIAQAIFDLWGTPECDGYLNKLIIDDRGNRAGFPPEVLRALLDLSEQHQSRFAFDPLEPLWGHGRR